MYHISVHISTTQTKKTPSQERPRDGISLISRLIATTFRNPSLDMVPQTNRVEAAVPPSTPDRPVSAARRKIHYTGRVIKRAPVTRHGNCPGGGNPLIYRLFQPSLLNYVSVVLQSRYRPYKGTCPREQPSLLCSRSVQKTPGPSAETRDCRKCRQFSSDSQSRQPS